MDTEVFRPIHYNIIGKKFVTYRDGGMGVKLTDQLVSEVNKRAGEINQLRHGEVILKVQDGKVVWGEIKTVWKADSNKREARA